MISPLTPCERSVLLDAVSEILRRLDEQERRPTRRTSTTTRRVQRDFPTAS